jgi:LacI family transcriptional regulator
MTTVTIKDIARALGLAPSTVSMALNDHPRISTKTKQRVKATARKLRYRPNLIARAMVRKQTHLIGLIVTDIMSSFFPQIIQGIEDIISKRFYSAILCATNDESRREREYLTLMREKRVDGIIAEPAHGQTNLRLWREVMTRKIPLVSILRRLPVDDTVYVGVDNFKGGYIATRHLIQQGHETIGHLAGPESLQVSADRCEGFMAALREKGLGVYEQLIIATRFNWEEGYRAMRQMLERKPRPTGVFCASDIVAIGASYAIRESGLRVPQDIALVGFDDLFFASIAEVPLTTVAQPKYELGVLAAKKLQAIMQGKTTKSAVLEPHLVIRNSCGERLNAKAMTLATGPRASPQQQTETLPA